MMKLPVIQMWQPWASWVVEGWKTIETRTHNKFRWMNNSAVAIHACLKWDKTAIELARPYLTQEQIARTEEFKNLRGYLIGTAFVEDFMILDRDDSRFALIDCEHTLRYGLFLNDIAKITPVKFTGAQHQLFISQQILFPITKK